MIECSGGQGVWAAERLGAGQHPRLAPRLSSASFPIEPAGPSRFPLFSRNLVSFAGGPRLVRSGIRTASFDFNTDLWRRQGPLGRCAMDRGGDGTRAARPQKIRIDDIMWAVRTEKLTGDTAGYGQVVPLAAPAVMTRCVISGTRRSAPLRRTLRAGLHGHARGAGGISPAPLSHFRGGFALRMGSLRHARNGRSDSQFRPFPRGDQSALRGAGLQAPALSRLPESGGVPPGGYRNLGIHRASA